MENSGVVDVLKRILLGAMQKCISDKIRFVRLPQSAVNVVGCTLPI